MKIKKLLILSVLLFVSSDLFAYVERNKIVVFFVENFDNVSAKVIKKIESSDKFCLSVTFDGNKYINKTVQNLIISRKIEPTVKVSEPYFPLISQDVEIGSSAVLNKVDDFKIFLQNYKNTYKTLFEIKKRGLYLKGAALNETVLDMFYKYNFLWVTAKSKDDKKGLFIKNGVALFVPYFDFPVNETKIKDWLSSLDGQKIIPIVLSSKHINNEKFMLGVINFFEKSKDFDTELPVNAAYYGYNASAAKTDFKFELLPDVPAENKLKLYLANKEVENCKKSSEIYQILCDELSNMYSYDVINGIINKNKNSVQLFDISYTNIFRVLNKKSPNLKDFEYVLTQEKENNFGGQDETLSEKNDCEFVQNGDGSITINNFGEYFTYFTVIKGVNSVMFETNVDWSKTDYFDIYIDMNEIAYTGYQKMLKPLNAFFVPENSWEYAIRVGKTKIEIYKSVAENAEPVGTFLVDEITDKIEIPLSILRGNPYNWSYQVIAVKGNEIADFIEDETEKEKLFKTVPLQIKMFKYIK